MKRNYKNKLNLNNTLDPESRVEEIMKQSLNHADYLPNPLTYEDIDRAFKQWVENEINIVQDGIKLPTMNLFSNQRFSEYMQTWQYTDENNNIRLNFKTVTRENNPNHGTIVGDTYNIPGERYYTLKTIQAIDESGKRYRIDYKMKQPTSVDLRYKVSVMTNRYITLNEFNEITHNKFNALQCYICPNGHYMPMKLENISDESEYNISDRQFFSQSFTVLVKAYIIREDDLIVEENPIASTIMFGDEGKRPKPTIELSEYDPCLIEAEVPFYRKEIDIDIDISYCFPKLGNICFTMDEDFIITGVTFLDDNNIEPHGIKLFINDELITNNLCGEAFEGYIPLPYIPQDGTPVNTLNCQELPSKQEEKYKYVFFGDAYYIWHQIILKDGDEVKIKTSRINRHKKEGSFTLNGYNKFSLFKEKDMTIEEIGNNLINADILIENECK